jgi:predicted AAA+ superfamily ATPase
MYKRIIDLSKSQSETSFLWGERRTGKSTLLKARFPESKRYDLLLASEYRRLLQNPGVIHEEILAVKSAHRKPANPIIIDEIQKIPELLDEVHWLIENIGFLKSRHSRTANW